MECAEVWPVIDSSFSHQLQQRLVQKLYLGGGVIEVVCSNRS